jgi:hypothetical protein
MIGSIRKHSAVLWWTIVPLTIISFVIFMGSGPMRNGNGTRRGGYGTLYGQPVTDEAYAAAEREFYIYFFMNYGEWPDKSPSVTPKVIEQQTYIRLLLAQKAKSLGIQVPEEVVASVASQMLQSPAVTRLFGSSVRSVPMSKFLELVLQPRGFTDDDFQRFVRADIVVQQLQLALGLSGALVPPQEAGRLYDREHQEVSAQAVFFSATNYLAQVSVTPAAIAQFYTNNMAVYREPDRVAVNYIAYDLTNFFAAAEAKLGPTNLANQVESIYVQHAAEIAPDAKTPAEAKAKIRDLVLRQAAGAAAGIEAKEFVTELFAMDPVSPENLVTLARKKGLTLRTTAPFSEALGPEDVAAPAEFTKIAFKLNADSPFSKPISGANAIYVIGLANQVPSSIPSLDEIRARVVRDFENHEAASKAQAAGTNFYYSAAVQVAAGKTFAQAAIAAGQSPEVLPSFSLSSSDLPELAGRAELGQLKQAAFTTPVGHLSRFVATADGGFVLLVQSLLPVDESKRNAELPQFIAQVRRARQGEAFNLWLQGEANREFRNTPLYQEMTSDPASAH